MLIKTFESLLKTYNYRLCNNLEHLRLTRYCIDVSWVRWKMSAPHIILNNLPSLCQKLSDLVEVWRSYNKNNFACFFETRCRLYGWRFLQVWWPNQQCQSTEGGWL